MYVNIFENMLSHTVNFIWLPVNFGYNDPMVINNVDFCTNLPLSGAKVID